MLKNKEELIRESERKRKEQIFTASGPIIQSDEYQYKKTNIYEYPHDECKDKEPNWEAKLGLYM